MVGVGLSEEDTRQAPPMPPDSENSTKLEISAKMKRRRAGLELGQRIEDFELQGFLGRGSYASVYKACSRHSNRLVAIKVIDKQLIAACPGLADRVRYEAETHIALDHPSIVRLHTFFEDHSRVYFVMDLCEGGELYHYLRKRGGGMAIPEGRKMFEQVVRGVQHLHSQNIAHRDLKLSNLLLTSDLEVKISDFGLSVTLAGEGGESGTVCGTPNYMAPEVISRAPHGLSSDVWALGCLLYTLLVGCPPFESSTVEATLDRIARVQFEIPPHLPPPAADLIRSLLVRDPAARMSLEGILSHPFVRCRSPDGLASPGAAHRASEDKNKESSGLRPARGMPPELLAAPPQPLPAAHVTVHASVHSDPERRAHTGVHAGLSECAEEWGPAAHGSAHRKQPPPSLVPQREEIDHPPRASSPSPHMSSGKALRDRLAMASRSWDPAGSAAARDESSNTKNGSGNAKYGSANALGAPGHSSTQHSAGWEEARAHRSQAPHGLAAPTGRREHSRGLREDEGHLGGQAGGGDAALRLSLSEMRESLQAALPGAGRGGVAEGSFASTMLSARSHTVATPVQSGRAVLEPQPQKVPELPLARGPGEAAARIDARGMRAHRYDTRHAEVLIDRHGTVMVNAKGSATVMRVELGGEPIRLLNPRQGGARGGQRAWERGPGESWESSGGAEEGVFSLEGLPAQWSRLYGYAAKVVALIQSKTAKVVYYSPLAKAQLMDDGRGGQPATFVCEFYEGGRVQSGPSGEVTVSRGGGGEAVGAGSSSSSARGEAAPEVKLRAHAAECLQICRSAAAKCQHARLERSGGAGDAAGGKAACPAVLAHRLGMHRLRADQAAQESAAAEAAAAEPAGKQRGAAGGPTAVGGGGQPAPRQARPPAPDAWCAGGLGGGSTTQLSVSEGSQRSGAPSQDRRSGASTAPSAHPSPGHSQLGGAGGGKHGGLVGGSVDGSGGRWAPGEGGGAGARGGVRGPGGEGRSGGEAAPELGAEGRVYEFEEASQPVVSKAAYFEGLGWVMRLHDGSVWGQLPDGSQVVATDEQVVAVSSEGERIAVNVEHGQLQGGQAKLPRRLGWSAQQVVNLREVL